MGFALNKLKGLICHKIKPSQTKLKKNGNS